MEPREWFNQLLEKYKDDPEYIAEGLLIEITEQILIILEKKKMTRSQLAVKLKCSNAYITKLLSGSQNLTLKKLVDIAVKLDCSIDLALVPQKFQVMRIFTVKKSESIEFNEKVSNFCQEECEPNIPHAA